MGEYYKSKRFDDITIKKAQDMYESCAFLHEI